MKAHLAIITTLLFTLNISILTIVESWLTPNDPDSLVAIKGYKLIRKDRGLLSTGSRNEYMLGGGLACYVRDDIPFKILEAPQIIEKNSVEYIIFEISPSEHSRILFGTAYRRADTIDITAFFETYNNYSLNYANTVVTGDLNTNLLDIAGNSFYPRQLRELIYEYNLYNVPFGATHHGDTFDTWLDVILTDSSEKVINHVKSESPFINRHDSLLIDYAINTPVPSKAIKSRDFRNCNFEEFSNAINNKTSSLLVDFQLSHDKSVNSLLHAFRESTIEVLDTHAPITERIVKRQKPRWFPLDFKERCKERDKLYKQARRTTNERRKNELMILYKDKRREIKKALNDACNNYHLNAIKCANTRSEMWDVLGRLGLVGKSNDSPLSSFTSEELVNHYATANNKHPLCSSSDLEIIINSPVESSTAPFNFTHFSHAEVALTMESCLKKSKGRSPDDLPLTYFRDMFLLLAAFFTVLFNFSIDTATYPDLWKLSYIIPLNKVKSPTSPADTRPVANLSHFGKVFDTLIYKQLIDYIEKNNLLSHYQSAFRSHHSTQTILLRLLDEVRQGCDKKMFTIVVLFDFKAAFDSISHKELLRACKDLNFSDLVIRWIHSYLSGRSQAVVDKDGKISRKKKMSSGVPQGSVLGPILFLILINSILSILRFCKGFLFADDLQIRIQCKLEDINATIEKINSDCQRIVDWADSKGLILNAKKTTAIIFGTSQNHMLLDKSLLDPIMINGTRINFVESIRDLGVQLNEDLSWNKHVSNICSRVHGVLHRLRFRKNCLSVETRKLLINALALPHLDYGCNIYNDLPNFLDIKLLRLANVCIRFIFNLKRDESITPYRHNLEWLTPAVRRRYFLGTLTYQILKNNRPQYLRELFIEIDDRRSSRLALASNKSYLFFVPKCEREIAENCFYISAIKLWTTLPNDIRNAPNIVNFKNLLFEHLFALNCQNKYLYMRGEDLRAKL